MKFSIVRRVGDKKEAETYCRRPIVATFETFRDRESVRKAGILFNKSQTEIKST